MFCKKLIPLVLLFLPLVACTSQEMYESGEVKEARVTDRTRAGDLLEKLPAASEKIAVSLYDFQDLTGQFRNNDKYSDFSSAVTKGGLSILTKALLDASHKKWFTVTERGGLKDLLQERQIIKSMRNDYRAPNGEQLPELPPLIYGGMLLQGGIVGYDSNVITGGAGALYLGIGGNTRYARDVVTVYLRAVSIQTGEVLLSVTSSKTIYSTSLNSNVLKYITFDRLLQAEAGFSLNEPVQLATRQAIETSVYSLIMEGTLEGLWDFRDPIAGKIAMDEYLARRDGPPQDAPGNDSDVFMKSLLDKQAANSEPMAPQQAQAVIENPVMTSAQMQPVVAQNLPPVQPVAPVQPVMQPQEYAQPQSVVVVMPAPRQPQQQLAPQPQNVAVQPAPKRPVKVVPAVRNRGFEPQVQPENGPISYNMQPEAAPRQMAAQVAPSETTVSGWGYDGQAAQTGGVMPVSYQADSQARNRPIENSQPVYY